MQRLYLHFLLDLLHFSIVFNSRFKVYTCLIMGNTQRLSTLSTFVHPLALERLWYSRFQCCQSFLYCRAFVKCVLQFGFAPLLRCSVTALRCSVAPLPHSVAPLLRYHAPLLRCSVTALRRSVAPLPRSVAALLRYRAPLLRCSVAPLPRSVAPLLRYRAPSLGCSVTALRCSLRCSVAPLPRSVSPLLLLRCSVAPLPGSVDPLLCSVAPGVYYMSARRSRHLIMSHHVTSGENVRVQSLECYGMDLLGSYFYSVAKGYGRGCLSTYLAHAQTCDNVRVQSATEWTASVLFFV